MSETSAYSYLAAEAAIKDSGLSMNDIQSENTGSRRFRNGSSKEIQRVMDVSRERGIKVGHIQ